VTAPSQLLIDLGVTRSHSRPKVSNDNPYSEAQFKTTKYMADYPERFDSLAHACDWFDALHLVLQPRAPALRNRMAHPGQRPLRHRRGGP
jgi:transposase InsO family protein